MNDAGFAIAGMHKLTTLDFPGVVSAIVFTRGCNFHCPYCHNAHLIPTAGVDSLNVEEVLSFLYKRRGLLEGVVISGGEPCLQAGLRDFCREAKKLGYAVKLDSNGSMPDVLEDLLSDGLLDYVAMDYKALPDTYYPALCGMRNVGRDIVRSYELLKASGIDHEFRTTCIAPFITPELLPDFAKQLAGTSAWFLQQGKVDKSMEYNGLYALSASDVSDMRERAILLECTARLR